MSASARGGCARAPEGAGGGALSGGGAEDNPSADRLSGACLSAEAGDDPAPRLRAGCRALGLEPPPRTLRRLEAYIALLQKWNRVYNLTAERAAARIVSRHILDSLTVLPYLRDEYCLEVGSGAGLPGLILALMEPRRQWCLLDSNGKKTRFLRQAVTELRLGNVEIAHARVEEYRPQQPFTTIVSRAFAPLAAYARAVSHLAAAGQLVLAMKAGLGEEETRAARELGVSLRIQAVGVPGDAAPRNLALMEWTPPPATTVCFSGFPRSRKQEARE